MSKTKLLKISKWMIILEFFLVFLSPTILESILLNDYSMFSSLDYWIFIAPGLIFAFIIKHIIQKTQSNVLIILVILAEGYVLLVLSLIVWVLGSLATGIAALCATFLSPFLPLLIAFLCDVIALFRTKD